MNINEETSFRLRVSGDLISRFWRALPTVLRFPRFVSATTEKELFAERTEREETVIRSEKRRHKGEAEQSENSGTKASLRGGLDLTSILGRVHSRRRQREESVPSPGTRTAATRLDVPSGFSVLVLRCYVSAVYNIKFMRGR